MSKFKKSSVKLAIMTVFILLIAAGAYADDPFEQTNTTVTDWIEGNLGLLMALVTFIIGAGVSIGTRKLAPLGWSIVLAFVIGGLTGMSSSFFDMGKTAFGG
jgi:type IV secretory pathway VirB2 component (pilin)